MISVSNDFILSELATQFAMAVTNRKEVGHAVLCDGQVG